MYKLHIQNVIEYVMRGFVIQDGTL